MKSLWFGLIAVVLMSASAEASTQWMGSYSKSGDTVKLTLTDQVGKDVLTATEPISLSADLEITLNFQTGTDPAKLQATLTAGGVEVVGGANVAREPRFMVKVPVDKVAIGAASTLTLKYGEQGPDSIQLKRGAAPPDTGGSPKGATGESLNDLIIRSTQMAVGYTPPTDLYNEKENHATIVVTPTGLVLARPAEQIDENDVVTVTVIGVEKLLGALKVKRASTIRTVGTLQILGGDQPVPSPAVIKEAANLEQPRLGSLSVELGDFAPGRGVVKISALTASGDQEIGEFDFTVSKLYSGMFSLGAIRTEVSRESFGIAFNGTDSVVTRTEDGEFDLLYTLMYTHFIWGKRDIEKPMDNPFQKLSILNLLHRINPTVGIVLNDISDNGIAGLSVDLLDGVVVTGGVHAARVVRVDENSKLKIGGPAPASGRIPTIKKWKAGTFWGVSIDLRAAVQLFGRVAQTGS